MEIIAIGTDWGYDPKKCDACQYLEHSEPDKDRTFMVACDEPQGICIKTKKRVYTFIHDRG